MRRPEESMSSEPSVPSLVTLGELESHLWEAANILRGALSTHRLEELHLAAPLLQADLRCLGRGTRRRCRGVRRGLRRRAPLPDPRGLPLAGCARDPENVGNGASPTPCAGSSRRTRSTSTVSSVTRSGPTRTGCRTPCSRISSSTSRRITSRQSKRHERHPRRRVRVPDQEVRRCHQQEGRRVLHPAQCRPADGRHPRPEGGRDRLRPGLRHRRHAPRGPRPCARGRRRPAKLVGQALRPGEEPDDRRRSRG